VIEIITIYKENIDASSFHLKENCFKEAMAVFWAAVSLISKY